MANKKEDKKDPRYNWIHIPENYFDRVKTKIIRNTENGDTKIVLYLKMLDAVKNTDGFYLFQPKLVQESLNHLRFTIF